MTTATLTKRPAHERGTADHGWLKARFTFSFSQYYDPAYMGFKSLRVINNDTIQPGAGFPAHPHNSMEIFTYVVEGQLEHRDSMGNGAIILAGDLQYMSAGEGIVHSEFNPSTTDSATIYQVWIRPRETGGKPAYAEKHLREIARDNELILLFSGDGRDGSTAIRQDAELYYAQLSAGGKITVPQSDWSKDAWLQIISGEAAVLGETVKSGDGLAIENADEALGIEAKLETKLLLFRLS